MRRRILCILLVFGFIVSCNINDNINKKTMVNVLTIEEATSMAQEEVSNSRGSLDNWNENSLVTEAFPIYLEGFDYPSYYDCKVTNNGKDAGYILVNVDGTDLPYVEADDKGLTLTEEYRKELGRNDFKIYRYDWLRSIAVDGDLNSRGVNTILSKKGFRSDDEIAMYRSLTKDKKCNLYYDKEELLDYKNELSKVSPRETRVYISERLNPSHTFSNGENTPPWKQPYRSINGTDYPIGCGPTALAIVYAYFRQFKGKTKLFNGHDLYDEDDCENGAGNGIYDVMLACAKYAETFYGPDWGATLTTKMENAEAYGKSKGYSNTNMWRDDGTYYTKFNMIKNQLSNDRPVIMAINSSGIGALNHYIVIQEAKRYGSKIKYYCNWGWGQNKYKWIYAKGSGFHAKKHSTYAIIITVM